ncbi:putative topoisomerase II medium subunit [Sinorhizobium phage phiM9]|uniref:DNA topoisomerase (ATP-hydrolyzing) n=1 Tax=Sinorhizobium phage phiM9 TaxID=1636182 RepID=A0A0F6R648_9CAUD|nr:putative topoisomerase II medium subunit [Sinorhizobium phage phiM9]AKE44890.1 putative topoisomerase II medium subunit [Sinorhizobium phage phiM9]
MTTVTPSEFILAAARQYSLYVCQERAIPSVTDGFKSSQRIASWCMKNRNDKIKVQALAGAMIESNLYVHGGQNAEGAISGMAGPFCNNIPVFDGIGNFGSTIYPKAFGAGRYTYVTRSKFMKEVIQADSNLYKMVSSVDGDNEICESFLPLVPTILLNGISGTAVGWSTDILPHKYEHLRDAVIRVLQGKPVGKIDPYFAPYPDTIITEIDNGRDNASTYLLSGRVRRINSNTVEIYAIPPDTKMDDIQEHLDNLIEDRRIQDYTNNTTDKVSIMVKMARKELAETTDEKLIDLFKLRTRTTERLVCVDFDGETIRQFNNIEELITEWVAWRFQFIVKRFDVMIEENDEELSFQKALRKLFDMDFVKTIPGYKSKDEMRQYIVKAVQEEFDLRPSRIDAILGLAAYRWTQEYRDENITEIARLEAELKRLREIRSDDNNMKNEWINDLKKVKF